MGELLPSDDLRVLERPGVSGSAIRRIRFNALMCRCRLLSDALREEGATPTSTSVGQGAHHAHAT